MRVLVVNAGSSSLKLTVLDHDDTVLGHDTVEVRDGGWDEDAVAKAVDGLPAADVVGHRVVHGGREFTAPVRLDDDVRARLDQLADLAPLHQPKSLAGIDAVRGRHGDLPAAACFDTAFHADLPAAAATYAVPAEWRERYGLRRYGFHGLSHAYASRRAGELVGVEPANLRIVVCHLGAGASLAAVRGGTSVDTTMGFTPLEGLVMATRSGTVDPGMLLWLQQHAGIPVDDLAHALEHSSGLRALAGTTDMREVLTAAAEDEPAATLAFEVYLRSLRAGIAAMTAAMGGLDVLVFTGGVGEHAAVVRSAAAEGLGYLGVHVDAGRNDEVESDADVSRADASVRTLVVTAREDLEIAGGTREVFTDHE